MGKNANSCSSTRTSSCLGRLNTQPVTLNATDERVGSTYQGTLVGNAGDIVKLLNETILA